MDFNERVIPGVSANFLYKEALARYEFASKYLKPIAKVLDLGCGTGYGTGLLAQNAGSVLGIDNDREAVEYAKKHYKNAVFLLGDAQKLTLKEKFDVICAFEIIEHFDRPGDFLKSAAKLLNKNGFFILSTPNKRKVSSKGEVSSPYHKREYSLGELREILEGHFTNVKIFGQRKSSKTKGAFNDFMRSQRARQKLVDNDIMNLRKLFPEAFKEKVWKFLGLPFGLASQRELITKDFPIDRSNLPEAEYFLAVCQK